MSKINLLPWREEKIFYKNNIFYLIITVIAIISFILILLVNFYIKILIGMQENNINYLDQEIATYKEKTVEVTAIKEQKDMALSRLEIINSLQAKRAYLIEILEGLVKAVPDGIVLDSAEMQNNILKISGQSESTSRVSLFMRNIESLKIFANPKLEEIKAPQNTSTDSTISFVMEIKITE